MTGTRTRRLPAAVDLVAVAAPAVDGLAAVTGGLVLSGGAAPQAYGITRAAKGVDFAVTHAETAEIERIARGQGPAVSPLRINGVSGELERAP